MAEQQSLTGTIRRLFFKCYWPLRRVYARILYHTGLYRRCWSGDCHNDAIEPCTDCKIPGCLSCLEYWHVYCDNPQGRAWQAEMDRKRDALEREMANG